jgi:hypothetical protein
MVPGELLQIYAAALWLFGALDLSGLAEREVEGYQQKKGSLREAVEDRDRKLIAYRAETSMASLLRDKLSRADDARALLRQAYGTEVDPIPDPENKTLTAPLHHLTQSAHDDAVAIYAIDSMPPPPSSRIRNSASSINWGHRKFLEIRSSEYPQGRRGLSSQSRGVSRASAWLRYGR